MMTYIQAAKADPKTGFLLLAAGLILLALPIGSQAQATTGKICDLVVNETPGIPGAAACLDLAALQSGGDPIKTAGNATRISKDSLRLCKSAFQVATAAEADIIFIYDNSGSMNAKFAYVDPVTQDTAFHNELGGCSNTATSGTVDFTTLLGPRSVPRMVSDAGCLYQSGDPYRSRGVVMKQALDYIKEVAPTSTAGAVGFTGPNTPPAINHLQPPLRLGLTGAVDQVKNSILLDTAGATDYGPPLIQAYAWLTDPSLIKTRKQAIVFLSDGGPDNPDYINSVNKDIPIYSIFLGRPSAPFAKLQELSQLTGGQFYLVSPKNVAGIHRVMSEIIKSIVIQNLPDSLVITNTSLKPPQVSRASRADMVQNPDSSVSFNLDSILALRQGKNDFTVRIVAGGDSSRHYSFQVDASGPTAGDVTHALKCRDQAKLVVLNAQGREDAGYPISPSSYSVKLTRASDDLAFVSVSASSEDPAKPKPWGDSETLRLSASGNAAGTTAFTDGKIPFDGGVAMPIAGNGVWESSPDGKIKVSWVHPRDPREFAAYELPAAIRPTALTIGRHNDLARPEGNLSDTRYQWTLVAPPGMQVTATGDSKSGCCATVPWPLSAQDSAHYVGVKVEATAAFSVETQIFDNLGQFVNKLQINLPQSEFEKLPRGTSDSSRVMKVLWDNRASDGSQAGTGAYILKTTVKMARGNRIFSEARLVGVIRNKR